MAFSNPTYSLQEISIQINSWNYSDLCLFIEIFREESNLYPQNEQLLILNLLMQRVLQFEQAELQSIKNLFC